jgi:hypothetical protein
MQRPFSAVLIFGLLVAGAGLPAWAHHSFAAAYDTSKSATVKGTIVNVRLTNPHSWFFLDVKDETTSKVTRWSFEAGTPSGMIRNGSKASELGTGAVVTIRYRPAKDSTQNAGMLQDLTTEAGKVYGASRPNRFAWKFV